MHEGRGYRYTFQRACVASSPEVPKVTWWKIATFLGYHLHWLTSLETSRYFRKIALRLGIFLAMFRECLCVVARQLAPKCRDFSNVAKLARQCKWPYYHYLLLLLLFIITYCGLATCRLCHHLWCVITIKPTSFYGGGSNTFILQGIWWMKMAFKVFILRIKYFLKPQKTSTNHCKIFQTRSAFPGHRRWVHSWNE